MYPSSFAHPIQSSYESLGTLQQTNYGAPHTPRPRFTSSLLKEGGGPAAIAPHAFVSHPQRSVSALPSPTPDSLSPQPLSSQHSTTTSTQQPQQSSVAQQRPQSDAVAAAAAVPGTPSSKRRGSHGVHMRPLKNSVESFVTEFVSSGDELHIPTEKRRNLEFWRQCRRLNGIEFPIPDINNPTSVQMPQFPGQPGGTPSPGLSGQPGGITFTRRTGGQVSVPMHMHMHADTWDDPYAAAYGFGAPTRCGVPPTSEQQQQQQQHPLAGRGHRRSASGGVSPRGGGGNSKRRRKLCQNLRNTIYNRMTQIFPKHWFSNRPAVIVGALMLVTVLAVWWSRTASAAPNFGVVQQSASLGDGDDAASVVLNAAGAEDQSELKQGI